MSKVTSLDDVTCKAGRSIAEKVTTPPVTNPRAPGFGCPWVGEGLWPCSLLSLRQNVSELSGHGIRSHNNRLQLLWVADGFSGIQKGGVARSLNRFKEYAKTLSFVNTAVWKC